MKNLLKNKALLIVGGVVVLVVLVVVGILVFSKSSNSQSQDGVSALPTQVPVPTITADSLGLTLKSGVVGKTVIASLANADGISNIEYDLSYTAKVNGEDVPRGVIGQFDLTKKPVSKEITLGTCSDVCHYDQGVKDLKLELKITKADGNVYQSTISLSSLDQ